jgi:hypothetical protein
VGGVRLILEVSLEVARSRHPFYRTHGVNRRRYAGVRRANSEQIAGLTEPETDFVLDGERFPEKIHKEAVRILAGAGIL